MPKQLEVDKFKQISVVVFFQFFSVVVVVVLRTAANIVNRRDADKAWRYTDTRTEWRDASTSGSVCLYVHNGMELLEIAFMDIHFCVSN